MCSLRELVNYILLLEGRFISIFLLLHLFFHVSLLVHCVCVWSDVLVRSATVWLHSTAVILAWPAHLCYTAVPAQNCTKLSLTNDNSPRSSQDTRLMPLLRLVIISTCQNTQKLHYCIDRFSIM